MKWLKELFQLLVDPEVDEILSNEGRSLDMSNAKHQAHTPGTPLVELRQVQLQEQEEPVPQLVISQSIAAGAVVNILSGWQYEYLPWPARIKLLMRATAATLKATVFSGSETIQEESPIQGGGTAGTTPAELTTPPVVWDAPAGDRLKTNVRSTDAGAQTIDAIIYAYPLG